MRARDRLLGLAVLLLLLSLAAAQRAVPASEVEGTLIPPRPALTIEVNDSSGLYDALLQAEGEEGEDLTVLLQSECFGVHEVLGQPSPNQRGRSDCTPLC